MAPKMSLPILGLKTDQKLLDRLTESTKQPVTKEELHKQRVSFVYGNLPRESTVTRKQVEEALARIEGGTAAA
jgi:hypothetical protein